MNLARELIMYSAFGSFPTDYLRQIDKYLSSRTKMTRVIGVVFLLDSIKLTCPNSRIVSVSELLKRDHSTFEKNQNNWRHSS